MEKEETIFSMAVSLLETASTAQQQQYAEIPRHWNCWYWRPSPRYQWAGLYYQESEDAEEVHKFGWEVSENSDNVKTSQTTALKKSDHDK